MDASGLRSLNRLRQRRQRLWLDDTDPVVEADNLEPAELAGANGFHAQACFFGSQAAAKALRGAIVELGLTAPHTPVLGQLVTLLAEEGLDASALSTAAAVLAWVEPLDQPPR